MTEPVRYHLGGFPPGNIDWEDLVPLIGDANAAVARYDRLVKMLPNAGVLLSLLVTREAALSSRIEGIDIGMGEALEIRAGGNMDEPITLSRYDDADDVINYGRALRYAADALAEGRVLSWHLLREAHAILMEGVRGLDKRKGAFRERQNWIGRPGCGMGEADFIPIPQEHLPMGLDRWLDYIRGEDEPDPLVQVAVAHAEFEALHPFEDGNGRLGRMVIPLFLYAQGLLGGPYFSMSGYLEARREEYLEAMRAVSRDGAWTAWCAFFLQGVIEQAAENRARARAIVALYRRMRREVAEVTGSQYADLAVEFLFARPVFSTTQFLKGTEIPRHTARRILRRLGESEVGILRTIRKGAGQMPNVLAFPELVRTVEGSVPS